MMTVDPAGEFLFGVVEVHSFEVTEPDHFIELAEGLLEAFPGFQVITGSVGVAGVDADPYTGLIFYQVDDVGDLFKSIPQVTALSSRVLDDGCYP